MTCEVCGETCSCFDEPSPAWGCASVVAWLLAMAAAWAVLSGVASAQPEVMLARTCVSEAGWDNTADCRAIAQVVRWRVRTRGESPSLAIRLLSPRLHGSPCAASRSWLCHLSADLSRPEGMTAPWTRPIPSLGMSRRDAWARTIAVAADALVATEGPCSPEPHAWGSDADLRRRARTGFRWLPSDCGTTFNHFGVVAR